MKAKLVRNVKKIAAVATGALFVGATLGMASVFASGLSSLPGPFVSNGHVNAVFVVGANAAPSDVLGAIDVSAALTAAAAATHSSTVSGQITIGTLTLSSKANSINTFGENGTLLKPITSSVNLIAQNFTSGRNNYTSVENLTFTTKATFNGLNVEFPAGSYELQSYIVNRTANSNKNELNKGILGLNNAVATMPNVTYYFGKTPESVLLINNSQAEFGTTQVLSNVKVPSTVTVGPNTVDLVGLVTFTGSSPSSSYNQLEVSVNGGKMQYVNFSTSVTIGKVTLDLGPGLLTNSTGSYLKSLTISSIAYTQNLSGSHVVTIPGLSSFNMTNASINTAAANNAFVLTATAGFMLPHSFTAATSFEFPENLTSIALEKLVPIYSKGENVSFTVGKAGFDNITVRNSTATVDVTSNVPNIAVGTGSLYTSSFTVPGAIEFGSKQYLRLSNILSNDTLLYNANGTTGDVGAGVTGFTNGISVAFSALSSAPAGVLGLAVTNASKEANFSALSPTLNTSTLAPSLVFYRLPNGEYLGLHYTPISLNSTFSTENLTYVLNFTASTTSTPTNTSINYSTKGIFSKVYGGYNFTVTRFTTVKTSAETLSAVVGNVSIKAPVVSFSAPTGDSIVPGASGIYTSSGLMNYVNVTADSTVLGNLTFNGSILKFTDPLGETQMANIAAYANGTTYFKSPTNTSANTWGDYATFEKGSGTFFVPTENYTLAVAGSEIVTGQKNYTIGQTVSTGELLGISGVSSISASGLLTNPDVATLDTNFTGSTNNVPVIVMGGPAVNTLADTLLNLTAPVYGTKFTNLTGVGPNEALIEMFNSVSAFNNQPALWIAGYSSSGTLEASEVLAESLVGQPIVNLTGNKVILSTASASYKGVTITNSSS